MTRFSNKIAELGYDGDDFIHNRMTMRITSRENGKLKVHNIYKVYLEDGRIEKVL